MERGRPDESPGWDNRVVEGIAAVAALWAASGAVVHLFPTGQGNIVGNPIMPVIKLSANPLTCETMSEHIDLNVSAILKGELTLDEANDQLIDMVGRTCNGHFTATKALGHREFVLTKLYISA